MTDPEAPRPTPESAPRRSGLRGVTTAARATGRAAGATVRRARSAARAEGAGESGLSRVIEMHAFHAAGDAAVAISLAGTLFFQVPSGEARDQVALFLGMTMLPFAILAPLIGPILDRFTHGRRWAIGTTMAVRAFLCWVLADAVTDNSPWLFPAALGVLVSSKAYAVTRAAAVPRVLPEQLTLVKANGRVLLAGVVGATLSAPIAAGAAQLGSPWALRYAFVLFVIATVLAILLPAQVDSTQGEVIRDPFSGPAGLRTRLRRWLSMPPTVTFALWANVGPRWLSGFLTIFMAFLLRDHPLPGWRPELLLGAVIGAAGLGNTLGIALASVLKRIDPRITVIAALIADTVAVALAAVFFSWITLITLGLTAGLAQSLAKLSLDSTIQREVGERVRTSVFALSDTSLQLAWVIGGFVGILLPMDPGLALGIGTGLLAAWAAFVLLVRGRGSTPRGLPAGAADTDDH